MKSNDAMLLAKFTVLMRINLTRKAGITFQLLPLHTKNTVHDDIDADGIGGSVCTIQYKGLFQVHIVAD